MKRYLFICSIPLVVVGTIILASMAYKGQLNSNIASIGSSSPSNPTNPKPNNPITPDIPSNPNNIKYYFKDDQELMNIVNSLYKDKLKSELIELAKNDIVSLGILSAMNISDIKDCDIVLPDFLSLSNVQFEIQNNIYKMKSIKNLNIKIISKINGNFLNSELSFFDAKWDIYDFIKK